MMLRLNADEIGGGTVQRSFTARGQYLRRGTDLTREQILDINPVNRQALIDKNFLHVFPLSRAAKMIQEPADRHVVSLGFGKFDVVDGRKLNDAPLTKAEASALAGIDLEAPAPAAKVKAKGRN